MANAEQVVDSDSAFDMTENFDGTYTYTFTPTRPGTVVFRVKKYVNSAGLVFFYNNADWSGSAAMNRDVSDINPTFPGEVFPGCTNF